MTSKLQKKRFDKLDAGGQKHHSGCVENIYPCLKCLQKQNRQKRHAYKSLRVK